MSNWRHPAVRSGNKLTIGERAADRMRNGMGSWPFVFIFLAFMAIWAWFNKSGSEWLLHHKGFDPYPFILLNLFLSMLAAIQGAILLIAAKRQDQIAAELSNHDYQTNLEALKLIKAIGSLLVRVDSLVQDINDKLKGQEHP